MKIPSSMSGARLKVALGTLTFSLFSVFATGCHHADDHEEPHAAHHAAHGDAGVVVMTDEVAEEFGVEVAPVGPAVIQPTLELTGEVRTNKDRLAHIVPRFGGIVTETLKQVGDSFSSGEALAVIESSRSLTPYSLRAMIDGLIIEKHATQGEALDTGTEAFVVADLSTVWVDLAVHLGDIHKVRAGQAVTVKSIHGKESANSVIAYVTPFVDEKSRTATARVVLENESGFWRPGMFATAEVALDSSQVAAAVPKGAVHSMGDETVVFVVEGDSFRPKTVKVGLRDEILAEVRGNLDTGQEVVSKGGFTVKSELLRDHFSSDHGH